MTDEEIQAIRGKYKNPINMRIAVEDVATKLAAEYIKQEIQGAETMNTQKKEKKVNRFLELENVLLDQIEKLNDDSLMAAPDQAKILVDKSRAISDLSRNYTEIQKLKLDAVKVAMKDHTYEEYLGIE